MNQTLTLLIVLFSCLFSLSCSDDDDNNLRIEMKDNNKWVSVQSLSLNVKSSLLFRVKGGSSTHQVIVSDKEVNSMYSEIASVDLTSDGVYEIIPHKIGSTTITITDKDNNSLKVNLEVKETTKHIYINDIGIRIEGVSDTDNALLRSELDKKMLLMKDNTLALTYTTTDSGKLSITDNKGNELYAGDFLMNLTSSKYKYGEIIFIIDNIKHVCLLSPDGGYPSLRDIGPLRVYLLEDFTDTYRIKYPDLTSAQVIAQAYWVR